MNVEHERALIGKRLKAARSRAKVSKEDAAAAADVPEAAIGVWERGSSMPCLVQFRDLVTTYGASPFHILMGRPMFGFTKEDIAEIRRESKRFTPGLQRRIELVIAMQVMADEYEDA